MFSSCPLTFRIIQSDVFFTQPNFLFVGNENPVSLQVASLIHVWSSKKCLMTSYYMYDSTLLKGLRWFSNNHKLKSIIIETPTLVGLALDTC